MNERIQKLMKQARRTTAKQHTPGSSEYEREVNSCFAKLIVRECGQYLMSKELIGSSDLNWSTVLNEHFGVE